MTVPAWCPYGYPADNPNICLVHFDQKLPMFTSGLLPLSSNASIL